MIKNSDCTFIKQHTLFFKLDHFNVIVLTKILLQYAIFDVTYMQKSDHYYIDCFFCFLFFLNTLLICQKFKVFNLFVLIFHKVFTSFLLSKSQFLFSVIPGGGGGYFRISMLFVVLVSKIAGGWQAFSIFIDLTILFAKHQVEQTNSSWFG